MAISRNVLEELYERLAEAIGAVGRDNALIIGNNRLWGCTDAIWRTGKVAAVCEAGVAP